MFMLRSTSERSKVYGQTDTFFWVEKSWKKSIKVEYFIFVSTHQPLEGCMLYSFSALCWSGTNSMKTLKDL